MFSRLCGLVVVCLSLLTACGSSTSGVGGGGGTAGGAGGGTGGGTAGGSGGGSAGGSGGGTEIAFPTVPTAIQATSAEKVRFKFFAKGTQNYNCAAQTDGGFSWAFVAPEANLYTGTSENSPDAGKHYAGPSWESANDGSKFVGDSPNAKKADSPTPTTAIPWLLIPKKSASDAGEFSTLTFAQRIDTVGGVAPLAADCNAGTAATVQKVPYTATYYFYQAR